MNKAYPGAEAFHRDESKNQNEALADYYRLTSEEIQARGTKAKKALGDDLLILCHHYQQDGTFWFADVSGDSLYLAQKAAATPAKYIVFCGVHFMAESADIITGTHTISPSKNNTSLFFENLL